MAFMKLHQGPKRFFPGVTLHCSFESKNMELDQEWLNVLKAILNR